MFSRSPSTVNFTVGNMTLLKILLLPLIILFCTAAFADDEIKSTQHPIDAWNEEKMADESVVSTAAMRDITNQARIKWDSELNAVYKRLLKRLNSKQQAALRKAQQQWLKYRDAEGNAISEIISSRQGTIYQISGTNIGMQLVRALALDLIRYDPESSQ